MSGTSHHQPRLVGGVPLELLMAEVAQRRPIFHSEADFQFALAQTLAELKPAAQCRLEVPQPRSGRAREYLDLLVRGPDGAATAVELKYFTRAWAGVVVDEAFALRDHAATDLARLHYVHDIYRLERFAATSRVAGVAIMLTNEPLLWDPGRQGKGNDAAFRIHEGQVLSGLLEWGNGYEANRRQLGGRYSLSWHDFSLVDPRSRGGRFRWTAARVPAPVR